MPAEPPLILTLVMDGGSFARFDALRRRHYRPERNVVPAHLTLFHQLPGSERTRIAADIGALCQRQRRIALTATALFSLGRGVAFALESPALHALRRELAAEWRDWLGPQDSGGFRPHVTVQNKVSPREAEALRRALAADFQPFQVRGEGLRLWAYLGGPWRPVRTWTFAAA